MSSSRHTFTWSGLFSAITAWLLCAAPLQAQDSLFYTNGQVIVGQVEEVGVDLVRYRTASAGTSVVIVAEKRDLRRVKLAGGQVFVFNNVSTDVPASAEFMARKQAISLDVLAPALNHITMGYEMVVGRRVSLSLKAGYIGLWERDDYDDGLLDQGFLVKVGPRFILPPSSKRYTSAREQHPLAGWYLRPELLFSYWTRNSYSYYGPYNWNNSTNRKTFYSSAALNVVIGRQVLLGERFTFDIHGGLGYGVQWINGESSTDPYSYNREQYAYSHAFFGQSSPLTGSGGMLFGYVF
jgi:hypothetical protein